jgi:hypothetical protein
VLQELIEIKQGQEIKRFGLAGWKPRDLPKHNFGQSLAINEIMVKVLVGCKHRPELNY